MKIFCVHHCARLQGKKLRFAPLTFTGDAFINVKLFLCNHAALAHPGRSVVETLLVSDASGQVVVLP